MRIFTQAPGKFVGGNIRTIGPSDDVKALPGAAVRLGMVNAHDGGIGPSCEIFEQNRRIDTAGAGAAVPTIRSEVDHGCGEQRTNLFDSEFRTTGENKRGQARNMGRREGRAGGVPVCIPWHRCECAGTWCDQVQRDSPAAETGNSIPGRRGPHGNGFVHGCGVGQTEFTAISSGTDEDKPTRSRIAHRVVDKERTFRSPPTHIDDMCSVFHGIENGRRQVVFLKKGEIGLQGNPGA